MKLLVINLLGLPHCFALLLWGFSIFVNPLNKTIGLQKLSANRRFIVAMISIAPIFLIQLFKRGFKILD